MKGKKSREILMTLVALHPVTAEGLRKDIVTAAHNLGINADSFEKVLEYATEEQLNQLVAKFFPMRTNKP